MRMLWKAYWICMMKHLQVIQHKVLTWLVKTLVKNFNLQFTDKKIQPAFLPSRHSVILTLSQGYQNWYLNVKVIKGYHHLKCKTSPWWWLHGLWQIVNLFFFFSKCPLSQLARQMLITYWQIVYTRQMCTSIQITRMDNHHINK